MIVEIIIVVMRSTKCDKATLKTVSDQELMK